MSMVYRGHVKDGVVVVDEARPPEGAEVRVELLPADAQAPSIWRKLRKYAGAVEGLPPDMARNRDHYIHGGPKK